jgi:FkbM family methyltransferase
LYEYGGFAFSVNNDTVIASVKKLAFSVSTAEELFILQEIFLGNHYNFDAGKDVVVVDIGMNVGMASLYFAMRKDVVKVYSYEPFLPTYKQGLQNLGLNLSISKKIISHNYGLSDTESKMQVEYNFSNKGQVGMLGTSLINSKIENVSIEKIELKPFLPEIQKIVYENPGKEIVLKIDCEGAEYNIFKALEISGIPVQVKMVMMEWHKGDPQWLVSVLKNNGFKSVLTFANNQKVGMIYACKS